MINFCLGVACTRLLQYWHITMFQFYSVSSGGRWSGFLFHDSNLKTSTLAQLSIKHVFAFASLDFTFYMYVRERCWQSICPMAKAVRGMGLHCIVRDIGLKGCRDGTVVRALTSHQCGLSSIPRLGVICGLTLLVLFSASRGFSPGTPVSPRLKNQHLT